MENAESIILRKGSLCKHQRNSKEELMESITEATVEKSEAFTTFKNYKNLVEKEIGAFIFCLRTDRGGEFTYLEFNAFCKTNGVSRQLTAAYTPQQNGVAERKNRTIMNMVRSMLSEKQVPKNFWPEAVNWTTHVLNRSPTLAVKGVTPEEAWSGVKPNVDYFRVFGCIGHVHVPDNKRNKLDDKSFQCVLLGVSEESKAYRLYDPVSKKIVVSRDVVFEEDKCWNWGRSNEEVRLDVLEWGDSNEEGSEDEQGEDDAEEGVAVEGRERDDNLSSSESLGENSGVSGESSPNSQQGRNRRVPFWMEDYLDVKSAFLHGELNEAVFIEQPQGYEKKGEEHKVYKLKKALYGLKQAPRAWYSRIEAYFIKEGFERCSCDHTLFIKTGDGSKILIVSLYVDDLIFTGNDESMFVKFKNSMKLEFDMTNLGKMKYFLGVEVLQNSEGIYISQRKYAKEVLKRFGMEESNSVKNPIVPGDRLTKNEGEVKVDATKYKQLVGSLMYLTATRPDLMYVVCLISRFMASPTEMHLQAAKRVLRYLKGTVDLGVFYQKEGNGELMAYTDSDYAGDVDDRKSTSGYVFLLSEGAVAWSSKKQPVVTLSTTEAKFVAAASCLSRSMDEESTGEAWSFSRKVHYRVM
ncbi:hypothetical protein VitviT2T_004242 [Vitis vinifera]|uniref:Integrase catalytic domain-containing protein n=1 Tax=Vitis vinifera TaxID=29760 RepID=A0ABY9BNZ4_VITVI|nr:hypothetical protein VitviT2T_004242 [Vitis vinifera]